MSITSTKKIDSLSPLARLRTLYDQRRRRLEGLNAKSHLTLLYVGIILVGLSAAFANRTQTVDNWKSYINLNAGIHLLDLSQLNLQITRPTKIECNDNCRLTGNPRFAEPSSRAENFLSLNLEPISIFGLQKNNKIKNFTKIEFTLPSDLVKQLEIKGSVIALGFPSFKYRTATLFVEGNLWSRFRDSERIVVRTEKSDALKSNLKVSLVLEIPDTLDIVGSDDSAMPMYLTDLKASSGLEKYLLLARDTRSSVVSVLSRLLIALFAVFLFVLIDSTPESFGLAMFLGCEGFALSLAERWIDIPAQKMVMHTFYQMGDIFRLYFFIQISRVFRPNTIYWLGTATLLSVPYGYFRLMETEWGIQGLDLIPRIRDLTIGSLGTILCLGSYFSIRRQKLPWRKAALILAAGCSFQQILGPLVHYFPELNRTTYFRFFFSGYESIYSFLGALSALTNISTLENRVSHLSRAKSHGEMIENELALGQTVQRSFMTIKNIPNSFEVSHAHEAAVYVSGDIFFMDWNEDHGRLVLLMCDVTGHGVQAALKATACYMLARNIWISSSNKTLTPDERFSQFRLEQDALMKLFSETPDIPTFTSIELYPREQTYSLYRSNFNAPIVVEPTSYGGWKLSMLALKDGITKESKLQPGSLIGIFSDGYVGSSRHLGRLAKYIEQRLPSFDGSPEGLKEMIRDFDRSNPDRPNDDRTLVVLCWQRALARKDGMRLGQAA